MNKKNSNIEKKPVKTARKNGFKSGLIAQSDDSAIFDVIGEYMKGRMDTEEVKNDPYLSGTRVAVKKMIYDFNRNVSENKENEEFIKNIFSKEESRTSISIRDEIKIIRQEIDDNKLKDITADWVREWHNKKQKLGAGDPKTEEIKDFVRGSIDSFNDEREKVVNDPPKKGSGRRLFMSYASLSAAALIGVFLLIRTLLPSSNPEKIFESYYKPFNAMSPVTRSMNSNETEDYSSAIESYRTGNYQKAATGFANVIEKDPSAVSPQFYMALSLLALRNYDQAINLFERIANDSGIYGKEARWYMGLTYLKTNNKQKASECFDYLVRSDGYFRERSEKILRRLK